MRNDGEGTAAFNFGCVGERHGRLARDKKK
jgi:hypothetical protein